MKDVRPMLSTRDAQGNPTDKASTIAVRLKEIKDKGGLRREASVGTIDKEARTVELSFSSEVEYRRWFGIEILSHDADAVDLSRLQNKAPLLWMHDWDDQRGVIESARIDSDRKGRAVVRFSKSEDGEQLFQDIVDGIITKVSVGYLVDGMKLIEERDDEDVFSVTSWTPYEISMVSVPADDTVGVGRKAEIPQEEQRRKPADNSPNIQTSAAARGLTEDQANMKYRTYRDAQGNLCRVAVDDAGNDIAGSVEITEKAGAERQAGADAERARVRELSELGKAYNCAEKAMQFIADGKTAGDLQRELLADFAAKRAAKPMTEQVKDAEIGLSDREVRNFSILRAVRALLPTATQADKEAAAFEYECSRAAEKAAGKPSQGIMIPPDVLNRAFSTTTPAGGPGSNVVAQELMAGSFIELLRKKTWLLKRATTMGGLVGNIDIPRQKGATQAYWVGEGGSPTSGEPALDQVHFTPKTLGAYTDITRRLMLQSTPDAELIVRNDILRVMALALDLAGIYGTGSTNQPKGLKLQTGINAVDFATAGKPLFTELVEMETQIALDDADVDSMAYAFNAGVRGYAKTALKFPGVNGSQAIWEQGNTINGYSTSVSNQIAAGDVFFGNWADFIVAMWGGLDLTVDPYSLSTSGGTRLVALQDVDFNIRHPESFCYGSDTVTP